MGEVTVFIVEDENIIAHDISRTLQKLGYQVIGTARKGEDAIIYAEKLKPDLILMDIMLDGEMTGIDASKKIMEKYDIPIIYLTALADEETLNKAKITEVYGYVVKPYDERALHSSIEMALYKHKTSIELKQRTKELEEERDKSNTLLQNILPLEIISELKQYGVIAPREYESVSLLFTDFEDFTDISSKLTPTELIEELNDIFKSFDSIIEKYNLEKLKTIGDSYMIGGGFPTESSDHAEKTIHAALEMQDYLKERNKNSYQIWKMRAGIHSGNVITGVVGRKKYTYDVWGDTVNIASRVEQYGVPGQVNITRATYERIKDKFKCREEGEIKIKDDLSVEIFAVEEKL